MERDRSDCLFGHCLELVSVFVMQSEIRFGLVKAFNKLISCFGNVQNKAKALKVLRARIYDAQRQKQQAEISSQRKTLVRHRACLQTVRRVHAFAYGDSFEKLLMLLIMSAGSLILPQSHLDLPAAGSCCCLIWMTCSV